MDTMAALAFGGSPALTKYLSSKPISREAPIINARMWGSIISNGLFMAISSVVFLTSDSVLQLFDRPVESGHLSDDLLEAKNENRSEIVAQGGSVFLTAFFSFFIFLCAFNAFNVRVDSLRLWEHFGQNQGFLLTVPAIFLIQITFVELGGTFLRTVPLTGREWATLFAMSAWIVPFDLLRKATVQRLGHRVERWLRIGRARGSDDKKHVV
jgi:magnesium-transporting ATPase (P-type)